MQTVFLAYYYLHVVYRHLSGNQYRHQISNLILSVESERRDMFKWLSTIQYATHHKTMGKDFLLGSGNWLLQKKEFVEWRKESSSSILWLHGIREYSTIAESSGMAHDSRSGLGEEQTHVGRDKNHLKRKILTGFVQLFSDRMHQQRKK